MYNDNHRDRNIVPLSSNIATAVAEGVNGGLESPSDFLDFSVLNYRHLELPVEHSFHTDLLSQAGDNTLWFDSYVEAEVESDQNPDFDVRSNSAPSIYSHTGSGSGSREV